MRKLISVFVFQNEHKMAASLRVVLGVDNAAKLTLPNGIPDSIEALKEEIQRKFSLPGSFRLQYRDIEFDNESHCFLMFRSNVSEYNKGLSEIKRLNCIYLTC